MNLDVFDKIMIGVYVQQKTYIKYLVEVWLQFFFKMFFTCKCIKIYIFFKKLFLISAHQNDLKHKKYINLKQRKKN